MARFRPNTNACWVCLQERIQDGSITKPRVDAAGQVIPVGCNEATFTGGGFDLQEVSLKEMSRIFKETNGDIDYLGDWHTHPQGPAAMSGEDIRTLYRIGRKVPEALMMILAGPDFLNGDIGCWKSGPKVNLFSKPKPIESQELKLFEPSPEWPTARLLP